MNTHALLSGTMTTSLEISPWVDVGVYALGFMDQGLGLRIEGSGSRVLGLGFRG